MSTMIRVRIVQETEGALPAYETIDSAGMDLRAHLAEALNSGKMKTVTYLE